MELNAQERMLAFIERYCRDLSGEQVALAIRTFHLNAPPAELDPEQREIARIMFGDR